MTNKWFFIFTMMSANALASGESGKESEFVIAKIATSTFHTCILSTKGQIKCWGANFAGGLGLPTSHGLEPGTMGPNLPLVNFGSQLQAKDVCVGPWFTCVATTDGRVKCWGQNSDGQLGQERKIYSVGDRTNDMGDNLPFTNLGSDFKAKSVHCGAATNCALNDSGKLKCWGAGYKGELGPNISPKTSIGRMTGEMGDKLPVVALPVAVNYVSMGLHSTCAASKSEVYCWGDNENGQAGIGSTEEFIYLPTDPKKAVRVKLEDDGVATVIESISSGTSHNCALYHLADHATEQKVKCWGSNTRGELGIGSKAENMGRTSDTLGSKLPETNLGLSQIIQLEAHDSFSCALAKKGYLKCWGENERGALGLGDTKSRGQSPDDMGSKLPRVNLGLPVSAISPGTYSAASCAILTNQETKCWGFGAQGALGYEDELDRGGASDDMGENLHFVRYK